MEAKVSSRLSSLDVFRGITIAGMILVNNPGSWAYMYAPVKHAAWNGLTPTDLIFPFFMFIMGISTYISLRKFNFECTPASLRKILKRTSLIFLIGLGLSWLSVTNFEHLRILGVLQRLAITYGIASLMAVFIRHKYIPYIIIVTLAGYFLLLLLGNGFATEGYNILAVTDQRILGLNHMFEEFGLDPEGILSTIPAVCHVLIGFYCGKILMEVKDNQKRMLHLFIIGAILTFVGLLLSYGCPVNKKIWSPTFVLVTCGMGATFLALLIWLMDVKGYKKWSVFFESFGVNPLFTYVLAGILATVVDGIHLSGQGNPISLKDYFYTQFLQPVCGDYFGSLVFALCFVFMAWLVGSVLYKQQIYIKI